MKSRNIIGITYADVSGFVRSFISGMPIPNARITAREDEELECYTDADGRFGPFEWPVGQPITLVFEKPGSFWFGYKTTQTATVIVPPEGINNANFLENISFQVPSNMAYKAISWLLWDTEDPESGHIAATVTPPNTTMDDIPQGIENVQVTLSPDPGIKPYYPGIFPYCHKTNFFIRNLTSTSLDGGVIFTNVPPGEYTLVARKNGIVFSKVTVIVQKGILVNASPPLGPTMLHELEVDEIEKEEKRVGFFRTSSSTFELDLDRTVTNQSQL